MSMEEKRNERYQQLLMIAQDLLIKNGLSGLSIEQLAKRAKYSRPTVYSHFESKKAVLDALARRNLAITEELTKKAATFKGNAREKTFALILAYELLARFHPEDFHVTEFLGMPWVLAQLPQEIAVLFAQMVTDYSNLISSHVQAAVDSGELVLPEGITVGNVAFHSLAMTYGIYTSIVKNRIILVLSKPVDPWVEARISLNHYWDGLGWSVDGDAQEGVAERFMQEVFPEYWLKLKMQELSREVGLRADDDDPVDD